MKTTQIERSTRGSRTCIAASIGITLSLALAGCAAEVGDPSSQGAAEQEISSPTDPQAPTAQVPSSATDKLAKISTTSTVDEQSDPYPDPWNLRREPRPTRTQPGLPSDGSGK